MSSDEDKKEEEKEKEEEEEEEEEDKKENRERAQLEGKSFFEQFDKLPYYARKGFFDELLQSDDMRTLIGEAISSHAYGLREFIEDVCNEWHAEAYSYDYDEDRELKIAFMKIDLALRKALFKILQAWPEDGWPGEEE